MIEFGKSLRAAREARGMTIGQLAEITRMAPTTIRELEEENFTRIAAPIYGRGFVKLYCEAVGLEKNPFVDEFMEIYNGNREPDIKERASSEPSAPEPVAAPEPPAAPAPILAPPEPAAPEPVADLFNQDPQPAFSTNQTPPPAVEEPSAVAEEPPPVRQPIPPSVQEEEEPPPLSRYAAPVRQAYPPIEPKAYLRLAILAVVALALLALVVFGIRAVYRATTRPAVDSTQEGLPTSVEPVKPAAVPDRPVATPAKAAAAQTKPAAKSTRTPQKVPSLYFD